MDKDVIFINYDKNISKEQLEEIITSLDIFKVKTKQKGFSFGALDTILYLEIAAGIGFFLKSFATEAGKDAWKLVSEKITSLSKSNNELNGTHALIVDVNGKPIYAIDRFDDGEEEYNLTHIPKALLKVNAFLENENILEDITVMQIFQDPTTKEWKYLFLPSTKAFGAYIDRIIDLETLELHEPANHQDFIEYYCGECSGNCCIVCAKDHLKNSSWY